MKATQKGLYKELIYITFFLSKTRNFQDIKGETHLFPNSLVYSL